MQHDELFPRRMFALAVAAVVAGATVAGARFLGPNLIQARSFSHHLLDPRQTPNVPPQCQSTCGPVISSLNSVRSVRPTVYGH